ncbi:hypothetical protein Hypma_011229 [Hypsizygus marmoreus]|uniref:Uncharacterized protein n=1 Tax=Hypsizygus marmoreus TaxID=39966 RepID=A0A369JM36_HYPMA|nr:hypothetical protein Hypma_011229 [Hypsizygus marmoreus]
MAPIFNTRALPQCLEELTIILETEYDQEWQMGPTAEQVIDDFDWMKFDRVVSHSFTGGSYTNLRKVHLELLIHEPTDADEDFARHRLFSNCPWLAERGLLSFGVSRTWDERLVLERFSVAKEI